MTAVDPSLFVRPYAARDWEPLRALFAATAFHGSSGDIYCDDPDWLADIMTAGYLETEPASCFVAEANGHLVGYLTGTLNTRVYHRRWIRRVLPRVIFGFFGSGVIGSQKTRRFLWASIKSGLRGESDEPSGLLPNYPAHFHINVASDWRSRGVGEKLAQAFLSLAQERGVPGIHIRTARSDGRHPFFESLGFRVLKCHPLTLWNYLNQPPMELLTYGRELTDKTVL